MGYLNSTGLAKQVQYIKAYVNDRINTILNDFGSAAYTDALNPMTPTEATNGTGTTARSISPKVLNDFVVSKVGSLSTGVMSVTTGNTNGTLSVDGTDVPVKGLGSAAYTNSSDYLSANSTAADSNKLGGINAANYAQNNSPSFTGTPTAPTAATGTNTTQIATTAFVQNTVADLVDSAPTTLDTLNELAAALGDDPNFATTIATQLGNKADSNHTHSVATTSANGFMSSTDKSKLDSLTSVVVSNDLSMPNSVTTGGIWVQLIGNSTIQNGETQQY